MADSKGKSNAQSLFGVHQIPSDNHIRDLLDGVAPEEVFPMFEEILHGLEEQGQLNSHLAGMALPTVTTQRWTGKVQETWTYRYLNGVP
jgi:hypothetical protein